MRKTAAAFSTEFGVLTASAEDAVRSRLALGWRRNGDQVVRWRKDTGKPACKDLCWPETIVAAPEDTSAHPSPSSPSFSFCTSIYSLPPSSSPPFPVFITFNSILFSLPSHSALASSSPPSSPPPPPSHNSFQTSVVPPGAAGQHSAAVPQRPFVKAAATAVVRRRPPEVIRASTRTFDSCAADGGEGHPSARPLTIIKGGDTNIKPRWLYINTGCEYLLCSLCVSGYICPLLVYFL